MIGTKAILRASLHLPLVCLALSAYAVLPASAAPVAGGESAHELVKDVFYNELQDRESESFWEYRIERRTGSQVLVSEQIETKDGPIHRLLSRDNLPLTSVDQREENARLDQLLQSPSEQARVEQRYEQDEQRLRRLMAMMPDAFLYEYEGSISGELVRLQFVPNPAFKASTFEARIFHSMAGTLWVRRRQKRMVRVQGWINERVDFGWGLLGHIEKGGTFEIERQPVSATHWKTAMIDVHIEGKAMFFKTISQNQHEVRSGFKQVPTDITLSQARGILDRIAAETAGGARRTPGSH